MQEHEFKNLEELETKIATNYSLIHKRPAKLESFNDIHNEFGNVDNEEYDNENFNIDIQAGAKCTKHDMQIHSYVKSNKVLL